MSLKHVIVTGAAALTISLSSTLCAQSATDELAAAQANKRQKIDAATAADEKFHANRTHANMVARDKAEAAAAAAINQARAAEDKARAAALSAPLPGKP